MISNTRQLLRMNVFICQNHPIKPAIQTDPKYLNANRLKCFIFLAAFSGYVMVYGKVAKMEKRIPINNFIRAQV